MKAFFDLLVFMYICIENMNSIEKNTLRSTVYCMYCVSVQFSFGSGFVPVPVSAQVCFRFQCNKSSFGSVPVHKSVPVDRYKLDDVIYGWLLSLTWKTLKKKMKIHFFVIENLALVLASWLRLIKKGKPSFFLTFTNQQAWSHTTSK